MDYDNKKELLCLSIRTWFRTKLPEFGQQLRYRDFLKEHVCPKTANYSKIISVLKYHNIVACIY